MNDTSVIDTFLNVFARYIDSGFGLLGGEVSFLSTTLIAIDVTLAGLFWAWGADEDVLQRLVKKTLYIGVFAFIIGNFSSLANIVFQSFAGLGLKASGGAMSLGDFMKPGTIAATGLQAAKPLMDAAGQFSNLWAVFSNLALILVLLLAWVIVVLAFFIIAVQVFITLIEFKLVTLAGFVLLPFAFFNKTAFMAERVLGNVISSGIKVMVLAVIIGIGTTLFGDFIGALDGTEPNLEQAMSLVLASIALFGLGIFGPGIAAGLVSGAPQLGAGAAVGTAGAVAAGTLAGGAAALGVARAGGAGALSAVRAGTALSSGASTAYGLGQAASGATGAAGAAAGLAGVARAGTGMAADTARSIGARVSSGLSESARQGRGAAWQATGGSRTAAGSAVAVIPLTDGSAPAWARRLRTEQRRRARIHTTEQAIKEGDRPGAGTNPDLAERE